MITKRVFHLDSIKITRADNGWVITSNMNTRSVAASCLEAVGEVEELFKKYVVSDTIPDEICRRFGLPSGSKWPKDGR